MVIPKLPKYPLLPCRRSYQTLVRGGSHKNCLQVPAMVPQKISVVNWAPSRTLHLSSCLGTRSFINKVTFCSGEFTQHSFFLLHRLHTCSRLVVKITITVNVFPYVRILLKQHRAQYAIKTQPVSPRWLYTTYLFLKRPCTELRRIPAG